MGLFLSPSFVSSLSFSLISFSQFPSLPANFHHFASRSLFSSERFRSYGLFSKLPLPSSTRFFNIFKFYEENAKTPGQLRVKRDLERGHFYDHNEIARNPKGKLFPSSISILSPSKSATFPSSSLQLRSLIDGTSYDLKKDIQSSPLTLVIVSLHRHFSSHMVDSWRKPVQAAHPSLPTKEIIFVVGRGYWITWWIWRRTLKNLISPNDQQDVTYRFGKPEEFCDALKVTNKFVAYAYLVDQCEKVRWMGCGEATKEETDNLCLSITSFLHKRYGGQKDEGKEDELAEQKEEAKKKKIEKKDAWEKENDKLK